MGRAPMPYESRSTISAPSHVGPRTTSTFASRPTSCARRPSRRREVGTISLPLAWSSRCDEHEDYRTLLATVVTHERKMASFGLEDPSLPRRMLDQNAFFCKEYGVYDIECSVNHIK